MCAQPTRSPAALRAGDTELEKLQKCLFCLGLNLARFVFAMNRLRMQPTRSPAALRRTSCRPTARCARARARTACERGREEVERGGGGGECERVRVSERAREEAREIVREGEGRRPPCLLQETGGRREEGRAGGRAGSTSPPQVFSQFSVSFQSVFVPVSLHFRAGPVPRHRC